MGVTGFVLMAAALLPPMAWASTRIDLDGPWQFRADLSREGETQGWISSIPLGTETVRVPHTWNIGKYDDYEGTAWYFKSFEVPEELRTQHVELHFGATFYKSRIWLNGVEMGGHEGGHTEYWFDITPHLQQQNFLAVELNNQPTTQTIPGWAMKLLDSKNIWYDWWHYGGIVRDVWLSVNDPVMIRRQQIRSKVVGSSAEIIDRIFLENHSNKSVLTRVVIKAWPPSGGPVSATAEKDLDLAPGAQEAVLTLRLDPVTLWYLDLPNVYRMQVDLFGGHGRSLDSLTDTFGVRTLSLRDRKLYLNGEPVRLTGMARHEDSPWAGLAEDIDTIRHDYDDMKNLQMTLTRPVHYPQPPAVLDYCDRHGILLIPEIPVWQFSEKQLSDPQVIALAKQMMREMIEQGFNHPSIFAWSACNESSTDTPGGMDYFKTMYDFIKSLDPDRYVSYADDRIAFVNDPKTNAASLADFVMWNEYFGTWHDPETSLPAAMERIKRNYPDKAVIVSEFGVAGIFAPSAEAGDKLRVQIFRDQMAMFAKQDWIAGALMWCYQDYKSHRNLWPGETEGIVNTGVVDPARQRRPSFFAWQDLNSPARVTMEWHYDANRLPVGFRATIERRGANEIPSYTLRGYRVTWEVQDDDNRALATGQNALPEIGPPQTIDATWKRAAPTKSVHLLLRLYRPSGFVATEKTLEWWQPRPGGLSLEEMKRRGLPVPE
jgi:beta-glucuronidase